MTDRQGVSTDEFLHDMAKGVGLIAVVGGLVSGQASSSVVAWGFVTMLFLATRTVVKAVALWALTVLMAAVFLVAGGTKLSGLPAQTSNFVRWGYPGWFMYVVGLMEAAGAILLLVPRLAGFAVLLLGGVMIGATATHLIHGETNAAPVPLTLLALVLVIGYARRGPLLDILQRLNLR